MNFAMAFGFYQPGNIIGNVVQICLFNVIAFSVAGKIGS